MAVRKRRTSNEQQHANDTPNNMQRTSTAGRGPLWPSASEEHVVGKITKTMNTGSYSSRKKMRFTDYDYKSQGFYFITMVTQNHICLFECIDNDEMVLNESGRMIIQQYHKIEDVFPQVRCLDCIVMPNHFHCILYLDRENESSIPKIMDYFKAKTSDEYIRGVKEKGWIRFDGRLWQRNYWDDIIWNDRQLEYVQNYIALNPSRWNKDNINPNHNESTDHILKQFKELG